MSVRRVLRFAPIAVASLLGACALGSVSGPNRIVVEQAATLVQECRYEEAEALIQAQLTTVPERYRGYLLLSQGQADEARGQMAQAIEHYAAAAASRSDPARARRLLGRAQVRTRQFEDGYQTLAELQPDRSPLLARDFDWIDMTALGVAAAETGRLADAASALAEGFSLAHQPYDPILPELRARLAAARANPGSAVPGSFWQVAYGTEGAGLLLDSRPVAIERKMPEAPLNAKAERDGGRVLLLLDIDAEGKVSETKVLESDPPGRLEATSIAAARAWRFEPAKDQCKAVAAVGIQRFEFGLGR